MCSATKVNPNESISGSGISAVITESISSDVGWEVSVETQNII
jgi:hypothetical protein